jgi:hypothetical protein
MAHINPCIKDAMMWDAKRTQIMEEEELQYVSDGDWISCSF